MGAKNNGVFIAKTDNNEIVDKKATTIIVEKGAINFSKKSRRENRHRVRNYKRRKLSKRLLWEILNQNDFGKNQIELINGLLNNRGYTFLSVENEFETLQDRTREFIDKYLEDLKGLYTKEDFEKEFDKYESEKELLKFLEDSINKIDNEYKKKKQEFYKEFQADFTNTIKKDLKLLKDFLQNITKEIQTGSKPRKQYLKEIQAEIQEFDFIDDKKSFFNLVGNVSNLQLRVLRKFFNHNSSHKPRYEILKRYFLSHHYKTDDEKQRRKELFEVLNNYDDLEVFLQKCNPLLIIPPYEDMNNRDTYKCNSMLIKPEVITDELKVAIDKILENEYFSNLLISSIGEFKKENLTKTKPSKNNQFIKKDYTYSKYLQRILDATPEITTKELNPRNVFKHKAIFNKGKTSSITEFKKTFGKDVYNTLKEIASKYYQEEQQIHSGIYVETTSIFEICQTNTPYKNNAKHLLLKPLYSYNFTPEEADKFLDGIKNIRGLKTQLELISNEAKKYQNGFYSVVLSCFENKSCVDDKELKKLIKNLPNTLQNIKSILKEIDIQNSYLDEVEQIDSKNISRVINICKQTYEILFKDLSGFSKTCKVCSIENGIRSDEKIPIAKRLLSDVAKPIDGMLDFMLDKIAYEITQNITKGDIADIDTLEINLEQNRFEFELNLNEIKRANNSEIKKLKLEHKDKLNINICPYTGEKFDKGDWDHILPQSKGVYNSKANMIYCSTEGNRQKDATIYKLDNLHENHLQAIFKTTDRDEIINQIKKGLVTINVDDFTNFNNLKLNQQIVLRYALFLDNSSDEFKKAFEIVKLDKIKTITNGTQKRLSKLIYEKLSQKYPNEFKNIKVYSKTIDGTLVSATRKSLAVDENTGEINHLFKEDIQDSHSHAIDAMVVFYLSNAKIKHQNSFKKETIIEPIFEFDDIYMESKIDYLSKKQTFIKAKDIGSYKLFDDTIYSEHYKHIDKDFNKLDVLMEFGLVYQNNKGKKSL